MAVSSAQLTQLYVGYFNRAPDPAGLNWWLGNSADLTLDQVAQYFAEDKEALATYPYLAYPNLVGGDTDAFVKQVYQNLFNRDPDTAGLTFWKTQLGSGNVSVGEFIAAVAGGAQNSAAGQDLAILNNKTTVGLSYATQVANSDTSWSQDSAHAALVGVDATAASVAAAKANITVFVDTGAWPGEAGTTFTLTTGVDNIVGTAANDTIQGVVAANNTTTLNPLDKINGGEGENTLNLIANTAVALPAASTVTIENIQKVNIISSTAADVVTTAGGKLQASYFGGQVEEIWQVNAGNASTVVLAKDGQVAGFDGVTGLALTVEAASGVKSVNVELKGAANNTTLTLDGTGNSLTEVNVSGKINGAGAFNVDAGANAANVKVETINLDLTSNGTVTITPEAGALKVVDASTSTGNLSINTNGAAFDALQKLIGGTGDDALFANINVLTGSSTLEVNGGAGKDTLNLNIDNAGSATAVSLTGGAGVDTFTLTSGAVGNLTTAANNQNLLDNLVSITDFSTSEDFLNISGVTGGARVAINNIVANTITNAATLFDAVTAAAGVVAGNANDYAAFDYKGSAYIFVELDGVAGLNANDALIQLTGVSATALNAQNFLG